MYEKILAIFVRQLYKSCICKTGCIGSDAGGGKDSKSGQELKGYIPVMSTFIMGNDLQQAIGAVFNFYSAQRFECY